MPVPPPRSPDFAAVYREHVDFVWRCLRRLGVPAERAEDAAQDVFLVVARRLSDFEGRSSIRTWLFSIATRVAAQHRRAGGRERVVELLPTVGDVTASGGAELLTDTDRTAARLEAARILDGLLDTLPDDQRAVFILSEIEQLEAPEVAAALGVNVNTVYSRRRLAREKLERRLRRRLGASAGTGPLAWIA